MVVIQEKPSSSGNMYVSVLLDVKNIEKKKVNTKYSIIFTLGNGNTYSIEHFPNADKRDAAYELLTKSNERVIVLDLNKFFTLDILTSSQVGEALESFKNLDWVKRQMQRIMNKFQLSLIDLSKRDAFYHLNTRTLLAILEDKKCYISEDTAVIWSKTLYVPQSEVTPLQFFKHLINVNNESLNFRGI